MRLSKTIFEQVKPMQWRSQKCVLVRGEQSKACFSYPERGAFIPEQARLPVAFRQGQRPQMTASNGNLWSKLLTKTQNKIPQKPKTKYHKKPKLLGLKLIRRAQWHAIFYPYLPLQHESPH